MRQRARAHLGSAGVEEQRDAARRARGRGSVERGPASEPPPVDLAAEARHQQPERGLVAAERRAGEEGAAVGAVHGERPRPCPAQEVQQGPEAPPQGGLEGAPEGRQVPLGETRPEAAGGAEQHGWGGGGGGNETEGGGQNEERGG